MIQGCCDFLKLPRRRPCLILRPPAAGSDAVKAAGSPGGVSETMPVLSKFCGVVVRMVFSPLIGAHFHAICGEHEMVVAIRPVRLIQGDAPEGVRDLVLRWARMRQRELLAAWRSCADGTRPMAIAPLK